LYFTYILYSEKFDKIYVGQTNNLKLRLKEYNEGLSKYTKRYIPWMLIFYEKFKTRSEAMKREKELKSHKGRDLIRNKMLNSRVRQLPD
jgi:putative endonuclease